ncbi:YihY/virulence factor BrkB family protein, partial [Mesorhizobium sp.]
TGALSFGFMFGLAVALWSASNGIKTLFEAMNIAYEESEKRGFIHLNLLALGFTLGAILIGIGFIVSVGIVPAMLALLNLGGWTEALVRIFRWPMMLILVGLGITLIYRYGPSRERAKWQWATWGAFLAAGVWIAVSIGFSYYLENFADYNATYGALGAVIGLMMWTWISVIVLIVGAELNAEMEHQTAKDTTTGAQQPMGARGATVADTLGGSGRCCQPAVAFGRAQHLMRRSREISAQLRLAQITDIGIGDEVAKTLGNDKSDQRANEYLQAQSPSCSGSANGKRDIGRERRHIKFQPCRNSLAIPPFACRPRYPRR